MGQVIGVELLVLPEEPGDYVARSLLWCMATLYALLLLYASPPFPCLCTPFSFALVSDSHVSDQDQCPAQPGTLFT